MRNSKCEMRNWECESRNPKFRTSHFAFRNSQFAIRISPFFFGLHKPAGSDYTGAAKRVWRFAFVVSRWLSRDWSSREGRVLMANAKRETRNVFWEEMK
jgi:hypothetical protein